MKNIDKHVRKFTVIEFEQFTCRHAFFTKR